MKMKQVIPSVLVAAGISLTGCNVNERVSDNVDVYHDEATIYDVILSYATINEVDNSIDFVSTSHPSSGEYGIVCQNKIGFFHDIDLDGNAETLYLGELSVSDFVTQVFNSGYSSVRIGNFYQADKLNDDSYQVNCIALNTDKTYVYQGEDMNGNYYIPSDLTAYSYGRYIYANGQVSSLRAQEIFAEQINSWFLHPWIDSKLVSTSSVKIKK